MYMFLYMIIRKLENYYFSRIIFWGWVKKLELYRVFFCYVWKRKIVVFIEKFFLLLISLVEIFVYCKYKVNFLI